MKLKATDHSCISQALNKNTLAWQQSECLLAAKPLPVNKIHLITTHCLQHLNLACYLIVCKHNLKKKTWTLNCMNLLISMYFLTIPFRLPSLLFCRGAENSSKSVFLHSCLMKVTAIAIYFSIFDKGKNYSFPNDFTVSAKCIIHFSHRTKSSNPPVSVGSYPLLRLIEFKQSVCSWFSFVCEKKHLSVSVFW